MSRRKRQRLLEQSRLVITVGGNTLLDTDLYSLALATKYSNNSVDLLEFGPLLTMYDSVVPVSIRTEYDGG